MELPGALQLGELAAAFASVPVFPLFDAAYFIVSVLYLKYEPGQCGAGRCREPGLGRGGTPRSRHSRAFRPGLGSDRPVPLSHRCCSARARRSVSLPLSPVLFLWPRSPIYIRRGRS